MAQQWTEHSGLAPQPHDTADAQRALREEKQHRSQLKTKNLIMSVLLLALVAVGVALLVVGQG